MNTELSKQERTEASVRARQEAVLQELNSQLLRSEIQDVADKANVVRNTALSYLNGNAPKVDVATRVINASRSIILKREKSIAA